MYKKPPPGVDDVWIAVAICIGARARTWTQVKKKLLPRFDLLESLHGLDLGNDPEHDAKMLDELRPIVQQEHFTFEKMKRKSIAAAHICEWVVTVYSFCESQVGLELAATGSGGGPARAWKEGSN